MTAPRDPQPTVSFIDAYCAYYQNLFPEVRSYESFKNLHLGMISDIKRKTLPEIAKVVGLENHQSLHHFLMESPWEVMELRRYRLERILQVLQGRAITLIIDETGDPKQGSTTDYVKRQYLGNLGKVDNGLVTVTAYGVIESMTFPLSFEVYKPRERLKPEDKYQSKPQIAAQMIRELQNLGFKFELVLADSLYGESDSNFLSVLNELKLSFVVAIRSNHGVWLPCGVTIRYNKWRKFNRIFSTGKTEVRYIREIIYGKRRQLRYWEITTDPTTLPEGKTWWVMTQVPGITYKEVGNLFGLRTWVEYGLKQSKDELGWADFRLTHYQQIQKWWEIVCSAYLLISLYSEHLNPCQKTPKIFTEHQLWNEQTGWKNLLNNLRLIIQPFIDFNRMKRWLKVFPIPQLSLGFSRLISLMNRFANRLPIPLAESDFQFFST
jgi:SRSO17 transposase